MDTMHHYFDITEEDRAQSIDVRSAKDLFDNSTHTYLDVRTVEEYKGGHADVAKILNVPEIVRGPQGNWVIDPDFVKKVASLCKKDDRLIVGSNSGASAAHTTAKLVRAGFQNVIYMNGGYMAWLQHRLPVKVDAKPEEKKPKHCSEL